MKAFNVILKIVAALAAIAGIVYIAATYGDKIVAWCKKMLGKLDCLCGGSCDCGECSCQCEADCEECPCEDDCDNCTCGCENDENIVEEAAEEPAEEAPAEEAVQAEESDFEG